MVWMRECVKGRGKFKKIKHHEITDYCCLFLFLFFFNWAAEAKSTYHHPYWFFHENEGFFFSWEGNEWSTAMPKQSLWNLLSTFQGEVSYNKSLSTNNMLLPFFNLMGLVTSCATQGVNQIMLVVTVSYAIFFSKGAINFNDRQYSGWIRILYVSKDQSIVFSCWQTL